MTNTTTPATPHGLASELERPAIPVEFYQWLYKIERDVRVWDLTPNEIEQLLTALTTKADAAGEGVETSPLQLLGAIADAYEKDDDEQAFDRALMAAYHAGSTARTPSQANDAAGRGEIERLRAMLVDHPNDVTAGVPEDVIAAGMEVKDRIYADLQNYVFGETTDWDERMDCAAVFKAMLQRALNTSQGEG